MYIWIWYCILDGAALSKDAPSKQTGIVAAAHRKMANVYDVVESSHDEGAVAVLDGPCTAERFWARFVAARRPVRASQRPACRVR